MSGTFFDQFNLGPGEFHEFFGLKSDILVPQVTRNLIRNSLIKLGKLQREGSIFFEVHQIFADIKSPFGQVLHVRGRNQIGIFPFEHQTAAGGGNDQGIALFQVGLKQC